MQAPVGSQLTPEILEQNPVLAVYLVLVFGVVATVIIGSMASWLLTLYRQRNSLPVLPLVKPWEPRRWALIDLFVIGASFIALQVFFAGLARDWLRIEPTAELSLEIAAAGGLGGMVAIACGTVWICLRYQASPTHVGFSFLSPRIIAIGVVGGLLSLPLLYLLMGVVSSVTNTKYDHPLINLASESGQLQTYLMGCFAAVIAAPIVEEFLFRVILQGWLQSIPFKTIEANLIGFSKPKISVSSQDIAAASPILVESPAGQATTIEAIYSSPANVASSVTSDVLASTSVDIVPPMWPSVVTGVLFGLAHFEYGLSFVPLSIMGIFLGLIYRQTHSIWPCVIIHMMLNSFSMMMLGLIILLKQAGVDV